MRGSEFAEIALSGETIKSEHIETLVTQRCAEDQWIDFKSGLFLQNKDPGPAKVGGPIDPAGKLRRLVSSFANAEGGSLVLGVVDQNDRADHVDGCTNVGAESPKVWAERALQPLAYHLSAPFRCQQVEMTDGKIVLVAAVGRSDRLVPCSELGQLIHYMRMGEQSPRIPEYLVADVVLGRRQRPSIRIGAEWPKNARGSAYEALSFEITLDNDGPAPVRSFVWGMIFLGSKQVGAEVSPGLRDYSDTSRLDRTRGFDYARRLMGEMFPSSLSKATAWESSFRFHT